MAALPAPSAPHCPQELLVPAPRQGLSLHLHLPVLPQLWHSCLPLTVLDQHPLQLSAHTRHPTAPARSLWACHSLHLECPSFLSPASQLFQQVLSPLWASSTSFKLSEDPGPISSALGGPLPGSLVTAPGGDAPVPTTPCRPDLDCCPRSGKERRRDGGSAGSGGPEGCLWGRIPARSPSRGSSRAGRVT